ncbi:hypothetical protein SFOMI_2373 [Sphingobium fuliginis]|uniref:Uncharacterized protein n=1 Tax=Sphingobium fuliginis (strain ATCC 27551) TaxID=336203 RepID=A0A292ZG30_SPHSA|nr:hypothetical protein SFOMI_2373 [Sphingobium fuliginis]
MLAPKNSLWLNAAHLAIGKAIVNGTRYEKAPQDPVLPDRRSHSLL